MIKIDVISGFLGVGKTTFANKLLRHYMESGLRPVYIVNEFGQTGLDAEIIKADGFDAVEIEGGCICCTLKDDVAVAIVNVINTFSPTNIVFEPSGIFIFDNFFDILKQPEINKQCEIGSVITVVDSVNFSFSKAMYGSFVFNQIKNAPIILLSKLEKINCDVNELICDIKNINPTAFILAKTWSDWGEDDFKLLLNQKGNLPTNHHAHHHSHLKSITVKLDKPLTQEKINELVDCCKSGTFGNLCRVKGILASEKQHFLLNIAMQDVSLTKFRGMAETMLTFIGQAVNDEEIHRFF